MINIQFLDLDLTFLKNRNGDIVPVKDEIAVKRLLKHVILKEVGDAYFDPDRIVGIQDLLFENQSFLVNDAIKSHIQLIIEKDVPLVKLIDVSVTSSQNESGVDIVILFEINKLGIESSLEIKFNPVR